MFKNHVWLGVLVVSLLIMAPQAFAITLTVTKTADTNDGTCNGDCSLREAIDRANQTTATDTIVFASPLFDSAQTITLTLGELSLTSPMTIRGSGTRLLTVSGNNASRVFNISPLGNGFFTDFAIRNGNATTGGGILNSGTVVLTFMTVAGNVADTGAGIQSTGILTISTSTLTGNNLSVLSNFSSGAGLRIAGGTARLSNTTISGNSTATALTGGAGAGMEIAGGTVNMNNVTIANNVAAPGPEAGAGLNLSINAAVNLRNCLIANNLSSGIPDDVSSQNPLNLFTSNGNNLIESVQPNRGFTNGVNGDIVGFDPNISPALANNGGPTDTHALLASSLARDAGNNCVFNANCGVNTAISTTDQRGTGFSRLVGANVDIGAYELLPSTAAPVFISGRVVDNYGLAISGAIVSAQGFDGTSVAVRTNTFGYFRMDGFEAGDTVILQATLRRYSFETQVLNLGGSVSDLLLIGTLR